MISRLVGHEVKDSNNLIRSNWRSSTPPYHTGLDVFTDKVYNVCKGVVIFVGVVEGRWSVIVQVNADICIRYSNLSKVLVEEGQPIYYDVEIGHADKYVHFEYCTRQQNNSKWPVRAGTQTYYKQDTTPCLDSMYFIDLVGEGDGLSIITSDMVDDNIELDQYQLEEFSNGRGDKYVELWTR